MGLLGSIKTVNINDGVKTFRKTEGAVLLDVRTEEEYNSGYIEGAINIPLDKLQIIGAKIPNKDTPLFVHSLSGGRSGHAVAILKRMGYVSVTNIGGIGNFRGKVVR